MSIFGGTSFDIRLKGNLKENPENSVKSVRVGPFEFTLSLCETYGYQPDEWVFRPMFKCRHLNPLANWSLKLDLVWSEDIFVNELCEHEKIGVLFNQNSPPFGFKDALKFPKYDLAVDVTIFDVNISIFADPVLDNSLNNAFLYFKNKSLPVSKEVISCHSTMLESNFKYTSLLHMSSVNYEDFKEMVDLIYQRATVNEKNVESLLSIAKTYQVPSVTSHCERFLLATNLLTLKGRALLAKKYNLEFAKERFQDEFEKFKINKQEYLQQDKDVEEDFDDYMSNDDKEEEIENQFEALNNRIKDLELENSKLKALNKEKQEASSRKDNGDRQTLQVMQKMSLRKEEQDRLLKLQKHKQDQKKKIQNVSQKPYNQLTKRQFEIHQSLIESSAAKRPVLPQLEMPNQDQSLPFNINIPDF